jgi:hypothetical protein
VREGRVKSVTFAPVAGNPERDFGDARGRLDRGDYSGAVEALEKARRGFARKGDVDGLQHVLDLAELIETPDERTAAERDNTIYSARQNLRQATRTQAVREGREWEDPYPDIEAPAAPRTRVYFTRWVKLAIAIGVVAALAATGGCIAVAIIYTDELAVVVTNDTERTVKVRWCDAPDCENEYESHELDPNGTTEFDFSTEDGLDLLVVQDARERRLGCLVVPVRELYKVSHRADFAVSDAAPCPS